MVHFHIDFNSCGQCVHVIRIGQNQSFSNLDLHFHSFIDLFTVSTAATPSCCLDLLFTRSSQSEESWPLFFKASLR